MPHCAPAEPEEARAGENGQQPEGDRGARRDESEHERDGGQKGGDDLYGCQVNTRVNGRRPRAVAR